VDHAQQCPNRQLAADPKPWVELLPSPTVHTDFASLAALPAPDKHSATGAVQVALLERERLADPQPGAPEQHDQRPEPMAVGAVTDITHYRDDLFNRRRVGGVLLALVSWRTASVVARHGHPGAAVACGVQQHRFHESSLRGPVDDALLFEPNGDRSARSSDLLVSRRSPPGVRATQV